MSSPGSATATSTNPLKASFTTRSRGLVLVRAIPFILLAAVIVLTGIAQPNALSFTGLSLILIGATPAVLAAMAQLFVMAAGDIDLSVGSFISLINVTIAVVLSAHIGFGLLLLAAWVAAYILVGVLVYFRRIPSIVVTFGMASVWLGLAIVIAPTPTGQTPDWIVDLTYFNMPFVPSPIVLFVILAVFGYLVLSRSRLGVKLRAVGANPEASRRAGHSVLASRIILYALAAAMALLGGLAISGTTGAGDATGAASLVLPSIAAVIVGGGAFTGGQVEPLGAVAAAVAISLIASLLSFLSVPAAYSSAVQGLILIGAVGLRMITGDDVGIKFARKRNRSVGVAA